jgi:gliding-associated putative ABC transporter substrate-binding component GldG
MKPARRLHLKQLLYTIGLLIVINLAGIKFFKRFDLTQDKRYTLSEVSLSIVDQAVKPLYVDVFLKGNFPGEFKRLQIETNQLLEEFKARNPNVIFQFVNPLEEEGDQADAILQSFMERGLTPVSVTMDDKGKQTQETVFPWAIASYGDKSVKVPLLKNVMGATTQQKVESSVQHLEYAFANAFNTITTQKQKKIAVLKGNGELHDLLIADFVRSVRDNYFIGTFTLDSVAKQPSQTLEYFKKYDLAVIAKPTETFTDQEKLVLDQFTVNGGKSIWLVDQVSMEMDSLYNETGSVAFARDLNLDDMFFKYGIRMQPALVKDILATPIALATGERGSATQYTQFPWFFSPMVYSESEHPIVSNLDGVKFEFTGGIELLQNEIKKTILLQSSRYSKLVATPAPINLDMVQERPEQSEFDGRGNIPLAVLLEGKFRSVYENRVLPFPEKTFANTGKDAKMIVISDGDVIRNQYDKDFQPLELGYDKWTGNLYGNKEFLMNCVNYLLDDSGLINIRNKQVRLPMLDKEKVYAEYTMTQVITVGIPVVVLAIFGLLFTWIRHRRYSR